MEVAAFAEDDFDEAEAERFGARLEARISDLERRLAGRPEAEQDRLLAEFEQRLERETMERLDGIMADELAGAAVDGGEEADLEAEKLVRMEVGERHLVLGETDLELWLEGHLELPELAEVTAAEVDALAAAGYTAYNRGNLDQAIDLFQIVRALDRANPDRHTTLGAFYLREGSFEEALECLDAALELKRDDPFALANRAEARLGLGDLAGARGDALRVVALDSRRQTEAGAKANYVLGRVAQAGNEPGGNSVREE